LDWLNKNAGLVAWFALIISFRNQYLVQSLTPCEEKDLMINVQLPTENENVTSQFRVAGNASIDSKCDYVFVFVRRSIANADWVVSHQAPVQKSGSGLGTWSGIVNLDSAKIEIGEQAELLFLLTESSKFKLGRDREHGPTGGPRSITFVRRQK
jgi:hypothetical protein